MLTTEIKIKSPSMKDMELALKEILRLFSEGNTRSWGNDGEKTDYTFIISGEEEEAEGEDEE